jgi:nitrogen fixation NifU-like protein
MRVLYSSVILDRYKHPRHRGELPEPHATFEDVNPLCGDRIRIDLRFVNGTIEAARFRGDACAISMASADLLVEMIQGESVARAKAIEQQALLKALEAEIKPVRMKCVQLPLDILKRALSGADHGA